VARPQTLSRKPFDSMLASSQWSSLPTSPAVAGTNPYMFDEALLGRRTPPSRFNTFMDPAASRHIPPSDPWMADMVTTPTAANLENELSHLRETSSPFLPWTSPSSPSQAKGWNSFEGADSSKSTWDNSKWTTSTSSANPVSSQTSWHDCSSTQWDANTKKNSQNMSDKWLADLGLKSQEPAATPTSTSSAAAPTAAPSEAYSFNLFGRSLWNPLASPLSTSAAATGTATATATTWSPFTLFGSHQNQSNQNQFQRKSTEDQN